MEKLANLKGVKTLNRSQQKEVFGGDPPVPHGDGQGGSGGGGSGIWCKCTYTGGYATGPESSCDSCISYCRSNWGDRLISSLCVG